MWRKTWTSRFRSRAYPPGREFYWALIDTMVALSVPNNIYRNVRATLRGEVAKCNLRNNKCSGVKSVQRFAKFEAWLAIRCLLNAILNIPYQATLVERVFVIGLALVPMLKHVFLWQANTWTHTDADSFSVCPLPEDIEFEIKTWS